MEENNLGTMHALIIKTILFCQLIAFATANETFQRTSILYGLSAVSNEQLIDQRCHVHLQQFQLGVNNKQPWALKMFDASATVEPGFTFGNNFWLGNREICNAVEQPAKMQTSTHLPQQMNPALLTSVAPFDTGFRVVYLRHNSSWQVDPPVTAFVTRVHVGLCVPSACAEDDIQHLMESYLSTDLLAGNELFEMHLQYDYTKDLQVKVETFQRPSFYLCSAFVIATICLTFAAMAMRSSKDIKTLNKKTNRMAIAKNTFSIASYSLNSNTQRIAHEQFEEKSFITCFDIEANWQRIFAPSKSPHTFAALNGLRFGSALCVTFYHYLIFLMNGARNKLTLYNYLVQVGNVDIFVDVFFILSGFLQAYNHFRNAKLLETIRKNNFIENLKLIGAHLFHRYLRLAPMYFLVIGMSDFGGKLIDDTTLFHIGYKLQVNCSKYWWRNVLFIQNFFNHNDMCGLWTWSLACDMQFSILATVLLFAYIKYPRHTKFCLGALVVANIFYTYSVGLKLNFDHTLASTFTYLTEIYINPFSRILAYICGSVAGWWFVEQRQLPFVLSKSMQQFFGYLLPLVVLGCIFKSPFNNLLPLEATSILLLERLIFSMAFSILIVSNACGQMCWLFRIFESSLMQKYNKLAYAMFLLNPILVFSLPGFSLSNFYVNPLNLVCEYIGIVFLLILISILFTLLFDIPYQNLSRLLIKNQAKRKIA